MRVFTYSKGNQELRSGTLMVLLLLIPDAFLHWALTMAPSPWNWVGTGTLVGLEVLIIWLFTKILRTHHAVTETGVKLHLGAWVNREIPFADIEGCEPYTGRPPFTQLGFLYEQDENDQQDHTLFVIATEKREKMVALKLRKGFVFQKKKPLSMRVVVSVDEPELLMEMVRGRIGVTEESAPVVEPLVRTAPPQPLQEKAPRVLGDSVAIEIRDLVKRYGEFQAVKNISLEVREGEIIGFLGSNGAGKTTTIKMMTGQLRPSGGDVRILGKSVWTERAEALAEIGYVPDTPVLYEGLTARQMLWFVGGLYGMAHEEAVRRAKELLALVGLEGAEDRMVGAFSLGMKRKVSIAAGLMHRPKVLVLDEVTNGLDPKAAREVKDLIAAEAERGTTVFLTTHILDVVEELADRVAIVDRGELLALGSQQELREQYDLPGANLETIFLELTQKGVTRG